MTEFKLEIKTGDLFSRIDFDQRTVTVRNTAYSFDELHNITVHAQAECSIILNLKKGAL